MTRMIPLATVNAALDKMIALGVNLTGRNPTYEAGMHRMAEEAAKARAMLADLATDHPDAPTVYPQAVGQCLHLGLPEKSTDDRVVCDGCGTAFVTPPKTDADAGVRRFVALMRRGNPSPAVTAVLDEVEAALATEADGG